MLQSSHTQQLAECHCLGQGLQHAVMFAAVHTLAVVHCSNVPNGSMLLNKQAWHHTQRHIWLQQSTQSTHTSIES
jgi:hypothetical protein